MSVQVRSRNGKEGYFHTSHLPNQFFLKSKFVSETAQQRRHWGSRIYISTDMHLDLTTIQYHYTKLLAPRLHKPVPKCKVQKTMANYNAITMKKLKWGLLMSLQWLALYCVQQIYALALYIKKCNKIIDT